MAKKCPNWGCLEGVCWGAGGCQDDPGGGGGGYDVQAIDKYSMRLKFISCFLFSKWLRNGQKKCPNWGCLWGVWKVSVGCLDGLRVIWDTSIGNKIIILSEKFQSLSFNSQTAFSSSAHFWQKSSKKGHIFRPLLRGVKRHF